MPLDPTEIGDLAPVRADHFQPQQSHAVRPPPCRRRWIGPLDLLLVCFLGVIWVAIDSRHQGWHDKLVNTYVVRV